jgi:hypothetical protein
MKSDYLWNAKEGTTERKQCRKRTHSLWTLLSNS